MTIYREDACKIGALRDDVIVSVAGHRDFAFSILDGLSGSLPTVRDIESLYSALGDVGRSLVGTETFRKCNASFQVALRLPSELSLCGARFETDEAGRVQTKFMRPPRSSRAAPWTVVEVQGQAYLAGYFPGGILSSYVSDNSLRPILISMLSAEYSHAIRRKSGSEVQGVGGAVLGVGLSHSGVRYPQDVIHIYSDQHGVIASSAKWHSRAGEADDGSGV